LAKKVDNKKMSGILNIKFILNDKFTRLGYYYNQQNIKGHSFHYTIPTEKTLKKGFDILSKVKNGSGVEASWVNKNKKVFGTYLHTMFRNNTDLIKEKFDTRD
jgi:cobyrinic acid a,c-diamide synthase